MINVGFTQCHKPTIWGWYEKPAIKMVMTWGCFMLTCLYYVYIYLSTCLPAYLPNYLSNYLTIYPIYPIHPIYKWKG